MENIFENAKFGDKFKTRDGRMAIYLSELNCGCKEDKDNPPFTVVYVALPNHIKYEDGSEKYYHSIVEYNEFGKYNKFSKVDSNMDVVSMWKDSDETCEDYNITENDENKN